MPHRYFCEEIIQNTAYLRKEDAHHLAVVMRAKKGDEIILCDGAGKDFTAKVCDITDKEVSLSICSEAVSQTEPNIKVILFVGYPKTDKLEFIIQKATELGAVKIVPFFSKFCVVCPKKEDAKNLRYAKIAKEAAKQSSRGIIPEVSMPLSFAEMLKAASMSDAALFCYEHGGQPIQNVLKSEPKTISIITGSEGGFSEQEADLAIRSGLAPISLGKRILRCETAPLAALASVMTLTNNLE